MSNSKPNSSFPIRALAHIDEARMCAELMANSEPWITLRRSYEDSLEILCDPEREVYVALVRDELVGFTILHHEGRLCGLYPERGRLAQMEGPGDWQPLAGFCRGTDPSGNAQCLYLYLLV